MPFDPVTGLPIADPSAPPTGPAPIVVQVPPTPAPAAPAVPPGYISQEQVNQMLAQARQEEKDKLYPTIEELKSTVGQLSEAEQEREAQRIAAEQAAAEAERLRQEAEMSVAERLERSVQENNQNWEQRFAELQAERDRERILREKEVELRDLSQYRYERLQAEADNIAPQLVDFVTGGTKEAIDQSIELAKNKTAEIMAEVMQGQQQQFRQMAPPIAGAPPVDPTAMAGTDNQSVTYTNEQLKDMPIEEYARLRPQLRGAVSERIARDGLYAP